MLKKNICWVLKTETPGRKLQVENPKLKTENRYLCPEKKFLIINTCK